MGVNSEETRLLAIAGAAKLYLLGPADSDSVLMETGDVALRLSKQAQSGLSAAVAAVGDLRWPLGRDCSVLKVGRTKYAFLMPPPALLLYGLSLPHATFPTAQHAFDALLHRYSAFRVLCLSGSDENEDEEQWEEEEEESMWATVAAKVAPDVDIFGGSVTARVQSARRMSAVTKLVTNALLRGAINAATHVELSPLPLPLPSPSATAQQQKMKEEEQQEEEEEESCVLARVEAFTKVVYALENGGGTTRLWSPEFQHEHEHEDEKEKAEEEEEQVHENAMTLMTWTLNRAGLRLLVRATAMVHVARTLIAGGVAEPNNNKIKTKTETAANSSSSSSCFIYQQHHQHLHQYQRQQLFITAQEAPAAASASASTSTSSVGDGMLMPKAAVATPFTFSLGLETPTTFS